MKPIMTRLAKTHTILDIEPLLLEEIPTIFMVGVKVSICSITYLTGKIIPLFYHFCPLDVARVIKPVIHVSMQ